MIAILQSDPAGFVVWFGILCSTWSTMSRGSTRRSYLFPLGLEYLPCVAEGNIMVARRPSRFPIKCVDALNPAIPNPFQTAVRCCLMMALISCLNGIFIVEQPRQSLLNRHPRFRWLTCVLSVGNSLQKTMVVVKFIYHVSSNFLELRCIEALGG